jgi:uncharacterized membrane protein YcgQ (UPF0703/DUF1980 family)
MNNVVDEQLPLRLENNLSSFSITSFLFYFLFFLIFVFLSFFIVAYFFPNSIFGKMYNSLLQELSIKKSIKYSVFKASNEPIRTRSLES